MIIILRARFQCRQGAFFPEEQTESRASVVAPELDPAVTMEWGIDFESRDGLPKEIITVVGNFPVHELTSSQLAETIRRKDRDGRIPPPAVLQGWYHAPRLRPEETWPVFDGLLSIPQRQILTVVVPGDWSGKEAIFLLRPI